MKRLAISLAVLALAGCAGGGSPQRDRTDRLLARGSGQAQPSTIIAAELTFNRSTQLDGYKKAYERNTVDGALSFDLRGQHSIAELLKQGDASGLIRQTKPSQVAISCDGTIAVSAGRYIPSSGVGGSYYRIWTRRNDRSYGVKLELIAPDGKSVLPVEVVETDIARCAGSDLAERRAKFEPLQQEMDRDAEKFEATIHGGMSSDASLSWFAGHQNKYDRGVLVTVFRNGEWHGALGEVTEADLAPPPIPVVPAS